jgi:hypothetical protein
MSTASFDILRFGRLQEYLLLMDRMRSGPFEGTRTIKLPALPVETLMPHGFWRVKGMFDPDLTVGPKIHFFHKFCGIIGNDGVLLSEIVFR